MSRPTSRMRGLLTAGLTATLLTGCAADTGSGGVSHVAFLVADTRLNVAKEMSDGYRSGANQVGGVQVEVAGPSIVDGPKQLQQFQELTKTSKGGISVFTLTPEIFAGPMAGAVRDGIPLIAVDNRPPPSSNIQLYVGNDNYELGTMLADEAIAKLPPNATGKIILGTRAPGVPVLDRRAQGMRDQIKKRLPLVTVLGPFDTKHDVGANLVAWRMLVRANPNALAFLGTGDPDAWNLAAVRKSTHGTWVAGGFDLDPRSLQAVKEGALVLVSPEHFGKGAIAGRLQAMQANGTKDLPEGWIYVPGLAVNRGNIDAVIARQSTSEARTTWFEPVVTNILRDDANLRPLKEAR